MATRQERHEWWASAAAQHRGFQTQWCNPGWIDRLLGTYQSSMNICGFHKAVADKYELLAQRALDPKSNLQELDQAEDKLSWRVMLVMRLALYDPVACDDIKVE